MLVGLLVVLARRWPASYTLLRGRGASSLALTARNLDSLERYGLSTLPFVLALADVARHGRRASARCSSLAAAGLVAASVLAFTGVLVP